MKLIIAGGRDYYLNAKDCQWLDQLHAQHRFIEVVSGGCRGADKDGEQWAKVQGIPVTSKKPDYQKYPGYLAPLMRNQEMAEYADALAVFPGGNGTADMIRRAKAKGMPIYPAPRA